MATIAGFDVGGTNARLVIFDADSHQPLAQNRAHIREVGDHLAMADHLAAMLSGLATESPTAVGVGLAAQLSPGGARVINAPNLGWRDIDFATTLAAAIGQPVRIVNDLNALAWGEFVAGAAQDATDMLAVYAGTGVGGAIIADGALIEGAGGVAGEIGHAKVEVGGRLCGCGERGCVEAYAGGVHLERQVYALKEALRAYPQIFGDRVDLAAADAAIDDSEELAALWVLATDYLALTIANACTVLNPSVLLLGGGVLENLPRFRQLTLEKISPVILKAARDLDIRFGTLGDRAGALGAALLAASTT